VNPHPIKVIPGRKTDTKDCEWIADLLQHGLVRGSFVPPTDIQDLRDLTRYRAELKQAQCTVANRIQKLLEQANIKLSLVASNALGVSGRSMIESIIAGEDNPDTWPRWPRNGSKKNSRTALGSARSRPGSSSVPVQGVFGRVESIGRAHFAGRTGD